MTDESKSSDERKRYKQELAAVIEGLPRELRRVFVLSYVQQKSRGIVAAELGIDVAAVETLQTKSLAMCRARMSGRIEDEAVEKIQPFNWSASPRLKAYWEWLRSRNLPDPMVDRPSLPTPE